MYAQPWIKWNSGDGTWAPIPRWALRSVPCVLASLWRIAEWEFICQAEAEAEAEPSHASHPGRLDRQTHRRTKGDGMKQLRSAVRCRPMQTSPVQSCNRFSLARLRSLGLDVRRSLLVALCLVPGAWCWVLVCHEPNTRRSFDTCYPRSKFAATLRKFTFILHFNFVLCGLFNFLFANGINFDAMLEMSAPCTLHNDTQLVYSPSWLCLRTYQWMCWYTQHQDHS